MFRNLGIKVNLINTRAKLLEFLDDEIIDALSYQMRESGVIIRHNETYSKIEPRDDGGGGPAVAPALNLLYSGQDLVADARSGP